MHFCINVFETFDTPAGDGHLHVWQQVSNPNNHTVYLGGALLKRYHRYQVCQVQSQKLLG